MRLWGALLLLALATGCASLPEPRQLKLSAPVAGSAEERKAQFATERVTYEDGILRRDGKELTLEVFEGRLQGQGDEDAVRLIRPRWSSVPLAVIKVLSGALLGALPSSIDAPEPFNPGRFAIIVSLFSLWGAHDLWVGFHPQVEEACTVNDQNLRFSLGLPHRYHWEAGKVVWDER